MPRCNYFFMFLAGPCPVETGRKLKVHKMFNLRPLSAGWLVQIRTINFLIGSKSKTSQETYKTISIFKSKFNRKKCLNTEFYLVCIFPYSVKIRENTDQKKSIFGYFSCSDYYLLFVQLKAVYRIFLTQKDVLLSKST